MVAKNPSLEPGRRDSIIRWRHGIHPWNSPGTAILCGGEESVFRVRPAGKQYYVVARNPSLELGRQDRSTMWRRGVEGVHAGERQEKEEEGALHLRKLATPAHEGGEKQDIPEIFQLAISFKPFDL